MPARGLFFLKKTDADRHVCVLDGVFEEVTSGADAEPQAVTDDQSSTSKVMFHLASLIDETTVAQLQAALRRRILRAFVGNETGRTSSPSRHWS